MQAHHDIDLLKLSEGATNMLSLQARKLKNSPSTIPWSFQTPKEQLPLHPPLPPSALVSQPPSFPWNIFCLSFLLSYPQCLLSLELLKSHLFNTPPHVGTHYFTTDAPTTGSETRLRFPDTTCMVGIAFQDDHLVLHGVMRWDDLLLLFGRIGLRTSTSDPSQSPNFDLIHEVAKKDGSRSPKRGPKFEDFSPKSEVHMGTSFAKLPTLVSTLDLITKVLFSLSDYVYLILFHQSILSSDYGLILTVKLAYVSSSLLISSLLSLLFVSPQGRPS
jgi:hypothetical protein